MDLGIDAREIQEGVFTGIGSSLYNFLQYFSRLSTNDSCVLFSSKPLPFKFGASVRNIVKKEWITFLWDQFALAKMIKEHNINVFYSPYYKIPLFSSCKCISLLPDVMYMTFEQYRKKLNPLYKIYYLTMGKWYAHNANAILTRSQFSKKDIMRLYNVPKERIEVISDSISDIYRREDDQDTIHRVVGECGISMPYILYVGNFKPHKNVENIIHAFSEVSSEHQDISLVLVGNKSHLYTRSEV